jgi:hypothetical protein
MRNEISFKKEQSLEKTQKEQRIKYVLLGKKNMRKKEGS